MANFQTHLNVGILVSASATLGLHASGLIQDGQTFLLFGLGVIGSLLPDIDSDGSKPVNALFSVLGAALAFAMTLPLVDRVLPMELALIWCGVFICVRYGFFEIFARFTVHRGIWHSWLAVAVATLATTNIAHWMWRQSPEQAWIAGGMVGVGYLTHLCLDEFSSVDLFNSRVKRSFGTALKPFCLGNAWSTLAMLAVAAWLAWLAPVADMGPQIAKLERLANLDQFSAQVLDRVADAAALMGSWWSSVMRMLPLG